MMIWCKITIWVRLEVSRPSWKRAAFWSGQYLAGCPIHRPLFIYRLGENRLHVHILIVFHWSDMLYLSWKEGLNHAVNHVIQLILIMCMLLPQHLNSCYNKNELGSRLWYLSVLGSFSHVLCKHLTFTEQSVNFTKHAQAPCLLWPGIKLLIVWQSGLDLLVSSHLARFIAAQWPSVALVIAVKFPRPR